MPAPAVRGRPRGGATPGRSGRPRVAPGAASLNAGSERWFLALWPDAEVRAKLAGAARALIPMAARGTHPQDLHLTLRFLGPLTPEALDRVEAAAAAVTGTAPVPLCIDRVGCFPRSGVLWAGPSDPGAALRDLVSRLEEALGAQGLPAESRPFRAHITLARRVRRRPQMAWGAPLWWLARELVLAAGSPGQAPRYRVRRSWTLTGPSAKPATPRTPATGAPSPSRIEGSHV